mgnify:CR=1 FL=1
MDPSFWNEKYAEADLHYGGKPNRFLQLMLETRAPGKILLPAEGEGRNAVYAAQQGWEVHAFDQSERGRDKALALAQDRGVSIHFQLSDALDYQPPVSFDAIALIYAHLPEEIRQPFHARLPEWLKPTGELWLEAFAPRQLEFSSGGPKNAEMLYSPELMEQDFGEKLQIRQNTITQYELDEGPGHQGLGEVLRFRAVK